MKSQQSERSRRQESPPEASLLESIQVWKNTIKQDMTYALLDCQCLKT